MKSVCLDFQSRTSNGSDKSFCKNVVSDDSRGHQCLQCQILSDSESYDSTTVNRSECPVSLGYKCIVLEFVDVISFLNFTLTHFEKVHQLFVNRTDQSEKEVKILIIDMKNGSLNLMNSSLIDHLANVNERRFTDLAFGLRNRQNLTRLHLNLDLESLNISRLHIHIHCDNEKYGWKSARYVLTENLTLPSYLECSLPPKVHYNVSQTDSNRIESSDLDENGSFKELNDFLGESQLWSRSTSQRSTRSNFRPHIVPQTTWPDDQQPTDFFSTTISYQNQIFSSKWIFIVGLAFGGCALPFLLVAFYLRRILQQQNNQRHENRYRLSLVSSFDSSQDSFESSWSNRRKFRPF